MRRYAALALSLLVGCAAPPAVEPPAKPIDPTVASDFRIVPRGPDVASYPVAPEHVWVPVPAGRVFVTVKVANHAAPRIAPPVLTPPAKRAASPEQSVAAPAVFSTAVHFAFDRSSLDPAAQAELDRFLTGIGSHLAAAEIVIQGHTDSVGTHDYNQKLSDRRAKVVRDYFLGKGASQARIAVAGSAETQPAASNASSDGRAQNRRTNIRLTKD